MEGYLPTRSPISEPLANDSLRRIVRPQSIVNPESHAVVVAEIEFRDVAVKAGFAVMLVNTLPPALKHGIEPLGRVDVDFAPDVLLGAMPDVIMSGEVLVKVAYWPDSSVMTCVPGFTFALMIGIR